MMLSNFLCSVLLSVPATAAVEGATVEWAAPGHFIAGGSFPVELTIEVPAEGASLPAWAFSPAAFSANGEELGERGQEARVKYGSATTVNISFDLGPVLPAGGFTLSCDIEGAQGQQEVSVVEEAPDGLNFMEMAPEELAKYWVLMKTNQGDMLMKFWPQYAPKHVANFLDLNYTGFYEGVIFHRVIPGFMIQGGDPTGSGTGSGPRNVEAEFSDVKERPDTKHVRGVLSMARSQDPNSASCQFFVMHDTSPHLDGSYSAFGELVSGAEVVDKIVSSKRAPGDRPLEKQVIEKTTVLLAPSN